MTLLYPTASALDLARVCPGSVVLPHVREVHDVLTAGTVKHRFLQRCNEVGRELALLEIVDETVRQICGAIDLTELPLDQNCYVPEVTFAWNVKTGAARELGRNLQRNYSAATEDEIVGTADLAALAGDDAVFVGDWKGEHDDLPDIRRFLQLLTLGMMAAGAWGRDEAIIEVIRPSKEERPFRQRVRLSAFDLIEVREELRALCAAIDASRIGEPILVVSEGCTRCRAIWDCPAQGKLVRSMSGAEGTSLLERMEAHSLTRAEVTRAYHMIKGLEEFFERAKTALRGLASVEPIEIDDKNQFGPQARNFKSIVGPVGWRALAAEYGYDEAWRAAKLEIPNKAIGELAHRLAQTEPFKDKVKLTAIEKGIWDRLRAADAVRETQRYEYRKHAKPKGSKP